MKKKCIAGISIVLMLLFQSTLSIAQSSKLILGEDNLNMDEEIGVAVLIGDIPVFTTVVATSAYFAFIFIRKQRKKKD